jgi:hypothetical protein
VGVGKAVDTAKGVEVTVLIWTVRIGKTGDALLLIVAKERFRTIAIGEASEALVCNGIANLTVRAVRRN